MSHFDGVIFDFNGVLLWDNHLHEEAWRRYSRLVRGAALTDEELSVIDQEAVDAGINLWAT